MQYLKNNAILQCDKGLISSPLNVTSNPKIKNRDGVFATDKDNIAGINITHFTLCAVSGICRLNLDLSGQPLNWINTVPKVSISGMKPLYEASKCICPLGGIISSVNSGQI
jgi:hypothetical protein